MTMFKRWSDRRRIRDLARVWTRFRSAVGTQLRSPEPPSPRAERRYLAIQSQVARRVPLLSRVDGRRSTEQEAVAAARDMTELVNRVSTLADAAALDATGREAFLREWHVLYIFLRKLEGTMTGSPADGVILVDASSRSRDYASAARSRRRGVSFLSAATLVVAVLAIVVLIATIFDVGRDDVERWLNLSSTPATIDGAAVAQAPTGETEVPAPAAPLLPQQLRLPRLVQPVVTRYGSAAVLIAGGALLAGTLYLFRLRTR